MNLSFNFADALVALVIVVSAGYAAWRGFLSETLTIFAWAAAAFATLYFGPWLVPLARGMISTFWLASLVAYAGTFLAVFIPLSFISYRFSESVKHSPIGPLDRALGIAFGVVRGLVIIGLGYLAFTYFVPIRQQPAWLTEARFLPLMQSSGQVLLSLVPTRDQEDFANSPSKQRQDDALGDLIRRQNQQANTVPAEQDKKPTKTYGAKDRRALDSLLEATGNGGNRKP
jgi:membrane protein required for colicin V production